MRHKLSQREKEEWAAFGKLSLWERNFQGKLTRHFKGHLCVISWAKGGGYRWLWRKGEATGWSEKVFPTEVDAIVAMGADLFYRFIG